MKIVFNAPAKDKSGYLKRMKKAVTFGNALSGGQATPELLDDLVEFLADYVTEPKIRSEAIEALWDATEDQFMQLIDVVKGGTGEIDPPNAAP